MQSTPLQTRVSMRVAANDSPDDVSPAERLSWLVELMSRYAREFAQSHDSHESPRLAAAIVAHVRSLIDDLPNDVRLSDAAEHWIDIWDGILASHLGHVDAPHRSASLASLIERARAF
jgi:hypothetical protein